MKTNIEQVKPVKYSKPVAVDAWRFQGIPTFEQYRDMVLARSYPSIDSINVLPKVRTAAALRKEPVKFF